MPADWRSFVQIGDLLFILLLGSALGLDGPSGSNTTETRQITADRKSESILRQAQSGKKRSFRCIPKIDPSVAVIPEMLFSQRSRLPTAPIKMPAMRNADQQILGHIHKV
jgi:hypothetical protein